MNIDSSDAEKVMQLLDTKCWQCGGSGKYGAEACGLCHETCDICYGTGYQCTQAGIELLNFLRRQTKRIETTKVQR